MQKAKPAALGEGGGGHRKIQIAGFRPLSKNTLKGVFDVLLPSGLQIHGVMLHESNGQRWVGLPGRPYTDASGQQTYARILDFRNREIADKFRDAVLLAVDEHVAEVRR
jgi:hypothetical protein